MPTLTTSIAAVELIDRNRLRKSFVVQNEDTVDSVFLKRERAATPTVSSTNHDHRLGPGAALALNFGTDGQEALQDRWTIVASANTPLVSFFETEDIVR
jgi:hypothetical protein